MSLLINRIFLIFKFFNHKSSIQFSINYTCQTTQTLYWKKWLQVQKVKIAFCIFDIEFSYIVKLSTCWKEKKKSYLSIFKNLQARKHRKKISDYNEIMNNFVAKMLSEFQEYNFVKNKREKWRRAISIHMIYKTLQK